MYCIVHNDADTKSVSYNSAYLLFQEWHAVNLSADAANNVDFKPVLTTKTQHHDV